MLTNMKEELEKAKQNKYAIPHFNINNLEWTKFILEECNYKKSPVILGVSESSVKYMGGYNTVSSMIIGLIKDLNIKVPVSLHLDHGTSVESCIDAINANFTSVMIDLSKYSLEENIKNTKIVTDYAHSKNVIVEAEIGYIGKNKISKDTEYAKVNDAYKLVKETNIDLLAPALGSVHGFYKDKPNLDFKRMKEISLKTNLPLVLHGGSGIADDLIKISIQNGICKININTELQFEWAKEVKSFIEQNPDIYDPRKIIKSGEIAIKNKISEKLILLGSMDKA
ncbi:MAG: class II fructose-1,6-bisphosphate aldolase [Clostridium sp.]|nr:class II fructose-1,6-bisphosphate aldolase [Clostridium sp.]MCM1443703.1 class II fructose-1,6-bisphosphate aldolase [Candidatus Amulumruptor caecigallinarius]